MRLSLFVLAFCATSLAGHLLSSGLRWNTQCAGDKIDGATLTLPQLAEDTCQSATTRCHFVNDPHIYINGQWFSEAQKRGYNWVAYFMEGKEAVRVQVLIGGGNQQWGNTEGIALHLPNGNFFSVQGRNAATINCKPATAADLQQNGIKVAGAAYEVKIGSTHIVYAFGSLQVNAPECKLRKSHGWCSAQFNPTFQSCMWSVLGNNPSYVKNSDNYFLCKSGLQDDITKKQKDDKKKEPEKIECSPETQAVNRRACEAALIQFSDQKCAKKNYINSCIEDLCINRPEFKAGLLRVLQRNYLMHYGGIHRCEDKIVPKGECNTGKRKDYLSICYEALNSYDTFSCDKTNYVRNCMQDMCHKPVPEHAGILKTMKEDYLKTFGGEAKCAKSEKVKETIERTKELTKSWQKLLHEQTIHVTKIHEQAIEKQTTIVTNKVTNLEKLFSKELKAMQTEMKIMNKHMIQMEHDEHEEHVELTKKLKVMHDNVYVRLNKDKEFKAMQQEISTMHNEMKKMNKKNQFAKLHDDIEDVNKNVKELKSRRRRHLHINITIHNKGNAKANARRRYLALLRREARVKRESLKLNKIRRTVLLRHLKSMSHHRSDKDDHDTTLFVSHHRLSKSWLQTVHRRFDEVFSQWKSTCEKYKKTTNTTTPAATTTTTTTPIPTTTPVSTRKGPSRR